MSDARQISLSSLRSGVNLALTTSTSTTRSRAVRNVRGAKTTLRKIKDASVLALPPSSLARRVSHAISPNILTSNKESANHVPSTSFTTSKPTHASLVHPKNHSSMVVRVVLASGKNFIIAQPSSASSAQLTAYTTKRQSSACAVTQNCSLMVNDALSACFRNISTSC